MSNKTFIPLRKTTVSVAATSIDISLSGITGYKDLIITTNASITTSGGQGYRLYFNGDYTLGNYNFLYTLGSGSSTLSGAGTGGNIGNADTTKLNAGWIEIQDFTNNGRAKVFLGRSASPDSYSIQYASRWSGTSPITSVRIEALAGNLAVGSTFSVYGIEAFTNESSPKATGGYVYQDSTYWYHVFPFSSTFTPSQSLTADALVIAGGGGSGASGSSDKGSGGGGAGGLLTFTSQSLTTTPYTVTVGAGGSKGLWNGSAAAQGSNGTNSAFGALTAAVGGGGGGAGQAGGSAGNPWVGLNGGSGGGSVKINIGGLGTAGQGNNGGAANGGFIDGGAGGGGAGGAGASLPNSTTYGSAGGIGTELTTWSTTTGTGVSGYYAGGGGGGAYSGSGGAGGAGGGGTGGNGGAQGTNGQIASGGGAGGTGGNIAGHNGNSGGSGLVIVRYAK